MSLTGGSAGTLRKKREYNEEIDTLLDKILENEKNKTKALGPNHKQALTNVHIHELIKAEGYDIGLTVLLKYKFT